jgi:biopolymer transport protein ExbD
MLVHRKKRKHYPVSMPVTSLIDIVFLLLIYFLLTMNFMADEGIRIKLPQAKASSPQTEHEITVYVDERGRAFIGREEVQPEDLLVRLKDMIGERQDALIVIRADRSVVLDRAVKVMDVAKTAGAGRLCLATEKE